MKKRINSFIAITIIVAGGVIASQIIIYNIGYLDKIFSNQGNIFFNRTEKRNFQYTQPSSKIPDYYLLKDDLYYQDEIIKRNVFDFLCLESSQEAEIVNFFTSNGCGDKEGCSSSRFAVVCDNQYYISNGHPTGSEFYGPFFLDAKIITLSILARGDFVDPGPIEDECMLRLENYIKSGEYKDYNFSECKLIESKVGFSDQECPNGYSPQGCAICRLECR